MSFDSILTLGQTALELGLISSLTVLALFLSYSMLNVCDLSTDGCFTLGAVVGASVALSGHPFLAIPAAMAIGMVSGFVTALLQTKMGIDSLLAGIIVNTALYSVNIGIMNGGGIRKPIKKGEIMALENGKIVSTSTDITKATYRLARNMCKKDSSFVTIISGCDVSDEDAEKVTEIVKAKCPNHVEVSHIRGGQPVYYYMISVE